MKDTMPWKVRIAVLWLCGPILEAAHLLLSIDTEGAWRKQLGDLISTKYTC